mgnify:CR=1 FL=1
MIVLRRCRSRGVLVWLLIVAPALALLWVGLETARADSGRSAADIASADPRVAAVIEGTDATVDESLWGDAEIGRGATLVYSWSAAQARSVEDTWPLLPGDANDVPVPPFVVVEHHLRLDNLTSIRVDVLLDEDRILQIHPLVGETTYNVREETWPPFSWIPWFTARPWVIAPVLIALVLWVTTRAWRRSRAWNRRLPSMTRHDRQFILRLSMVLFLLAGIAWQVYETLVAARFPSVAVRGLDAVELVALPVLLFPPALFLAALALEFTPGPHRVAWGLVAVIAGAGSAYNLATATFGTAGNLNLSYYILLGVLALLTAPRAFSAGRMGWSRHGIPFYS